MSAPDPAMTALIEGGAATLARAWVVTRRDGLRMGMTEHDRDLEVDGVICRAETGATGSAASTRAGLAADRLDLRGLIDDARLTEADLVAGRLRGATVDEWLVDWRAADGLPAAPPWRARSYRVGETRRRGVVWVWEIESHLAVLGRRRGAVIQRSCPYDLGAAPCPVNLSLAGNREAVTVVRVDSGWRLAVAGLAGRADGWSDFGHLTLTDGAAAGLSAVIRRQQDGALTLGGPLPVAPAPGDAGVVTVGCARTVAHCREKFGAETADGQAFGGEPYSITEAEFVALPDDARELDGGSLRR